MGSSADARAGAEDQSGHLFTARRATGAGRHPCARPRMPILILCASRPVTASGLHDAGPVELRPGGVDHAQQIVFALIAAPGGLRGIALPYEAQKRSRLTDR